jgi:hypothetical protein
MRDDAGPGSRVRATPLPSKPILIDVHSKVAGDVSGFPCSELGFDYAHWGICPIIALFIVRDEGYIGEPKGEVAPSLQVDEISPSVILWYPDGILIIIVNGPPLSYGSGVVTTY